MTQAGIVKSSCSDMLFTGKDGAVRYQVFNQCDEFISAGRNGQAFCSKFNYHGFRYVIVEGLKENPGTSCAVAELIESDLESTGSFACSNERFNRIHALNQWTLRCLNLGGYLVDCPHRERLGYGDGQVSIESCLLNSNMHGLYAKWMRDWIDTQDTSSGALPFSTPYHPTGSEVGFGLEGPPGWGGTMPVLAWKIFLHYGDERVLSEAFQPMLAFMNRMESHCVDGILRGYGDQWQQLGDWVPPDRGMDGKNWPSRPANELFNNCYRVYLWDLMEKMSRALGRADEAERCRAKIAEMRPLIHREFYDDHAGLYVCDEQAYQVMPLLAGIVPSDLRPRLLQRLEEGIILRRKGHLDTGMLGTYFMMQFLSGIERDDLLYTIVNQETYPGWDYMLSQGATTMWEQWNGYWSRIHSCYTSPSGWFQGGLAGLQADPSAPGMRRFIVRPAPVGDLSWVSSTHQSLYGRIACDWRLQSGWFILNLRIPVNTTALVHLPSEANGDVFEGGMPVEGADGVRGVGSSAGRRIFEVEGGSYRFEVRWRK
jgi:alpha-L-rhamnosidase